MQTPDTQAELLHAVPAPHCPVPSQTCTPLPEHCVAPGVHTPVQAPAAQAYWHEVTAPHAPLVVHDCTPAPEHLVTPGAHEPAQTPDTHAELMQRTGSPQVLPEPQVCTPLPEHCVAPGVHEPLHTPAVQLAIGHGAAAVPQLPVVSHVCTAPPAAHWVAPGAQTPWQSPLTHARPLHGEAGPHAPLGLQV